MCRGAGVAEAARGALERQLKSQGLAVAGWRSVPLDPSACGEEALKTLPRIEQLFVNAPTAIAAGEFERRLYLARRQAEKWLEG